jgi:hypothetical protein
MKPILRLIACVLVLPTLLLFLPQTALCAGAKTTAKADKKTITHHAPKVKSSAEKAMTPELAKEAKAKKKKPNWLLIGLGAAVVVGLAAAMGAGGGDSGGGDPGDKEGEGDITVEW